MRKTRKKCGREMPVRRSSKIFRHKENKMELNVRAATGGRTLTVFGDSVAKGLYLETNAIKHIERPAAATFAAQAGMRLDNRSAFGLTLEKCRRKGYFEEYLKRPREEGDAAAIALGGNDCDYDWKRVAEDPFGYHLPHTPLPLFEEMLDDTITLFLKNGVTPALVALPPIISERFFQKMICARADKDAVLKFFEGDVSVISRHQEAYNDAVVKAALSRGCPLIDIRTEFLMRTDLNDLICPDGIHPNQAGHDLIAECALRQARRKTASAVSAALA